MSNYFPRAGSKVELAATELKQGPRSVETLARLLSVKKSNVAVLLRPACRHGYLRQFHDEHGVRHWALARSASVDQVDQDGPSRLLPGWPQVRRVVNHAPPSHEAHRFADPFRRTKGWHAHV
jgi:hypothetical protein